MNINLNENKLGHYEHIYFNIKLYKKYTGFPCIPFVSLVNSVKVVIIIH